MKSGLVNILTPSYNSAHLITRLLDSVLAQTYPSVEMFVIDDGSTDNTREVIQRYIPIFDKRGYQLHYVYQENGGQNDAINNGLKLITGEFLAWPDADDWYKTSDALEILVNTLNQFGDDVGVARCRIDYVDADSQTVIMQNAFQEYNHPCNLFEDAVLGTNGFTYAPVEFLIKGKFLDEFIKDREIFVDKHTGQNYQMLLPYLARTKCISIDQVLCCYLVRNDSHSHSHRSYEYTMAAIKAGKKCLEQIFSTLDTLPLEYREQLLHSKQVYRYHAYMDLDFQNSLTAEFRKHYIEAQNLHIPIDKRHKRLWYWTFFFNIKSYKLLQSVKKKIIGN